MGTPIDQERLNEVVVLGDNDTLLLIGNGADLFIRCAIPMRQIQAYAVRRVRRKSARRQTGEEAGHQQGTSRSQPAEPLDMGEASGE